MHEISGQLYFLSDYFLIDFFYLIFIRFRRAAAKGKPCVA